MSINRYGLVAHYQHYLTDGKLLDLSGKGNHGTINGATPTADHNGRANRGWLIDASGEYINCGDINLSSFYGASGKGTISISFKYVAEARERYLVTKYNFGSGSEFRIGFDNTNKLNAIFYTDGSNLITTSVAASNFVDNTWHYTTIIYDNTQLGDAKIKIYINGNFINASLITVGTFTGLADKTSLLYIGNTQSALTTQYYNSAIDLLSIYNLDKSASEMQKLSNYWRTH